MEAEAAAWDYDDVTVNIATNAKMAKQQSVRFSFCCKCWLLTKDDRRISHMTGMDGRQVLQVYGYIFLLLIALISEE